MRFWDSSALVPLCLSEPRSQAVADLLSADPELAVWWGSPVECWSAFARLRRDAALSLEDETAARTILERLRVAWLEILPGEQLRTTAGRILRVHALRAADALQLAAAMTWAGPGEPAEVVTFDQRLRDAATLEGLVPTPQTPPPSG